MEGSQIVVGARPAGDRQALIRLLISDLVDAAADHIAHHPSPGGMAIAVELNSFDVIGGAHTAGYGRGASARNSCHNISLYHPVRGQGFSQQLDRSC